MKSSIRDSFKYLLVIVLMSFPLFGNLGHHPIQIWDEARLATNAVEMMENGDLVVTYFQGEPDLWNTKPPMMIWTQVISMNIFGVNDIAVRLPSAFAALFTGLLLMLFSAKFLKDPLIGIVAALTLVTFHGFVAMHASRTGDYDAMLTLFTTLSTLAFFVFIDSGKNKYLYIFFIGLILAVLTKSIQGLLFLPAIFLYDIARKKLYGLLKNRHVYIGVFLFAAVVTGFYLLREYMDSGYLEAVQNNELLGRYTTILEENQHGFFFYFARLGIWNVFIIGGFILGLYSKNRRIREISIYAFLVIMTYTLVISISKTKLAWYDVPLYPFIAILTAVSIKHFYDYLSRKKWLTRKIKPKYIPTLVVCILVIFPYYSIMEKVYDPPVYPKRHLFYEITRYLKDATEGKYDLDNKFLLYEGYNPHNRFYIHILQQQSTDLEYTDWRNLEQADMVIVSQPELKSYIQNHYTYNVISIAGNIETYQINERKESPGN